MKISSPNNFSDKRTPSRSILPISTTILQAKLSMSRFNLSDLPQLPIYHNCTQLPTQPSDLVQLPIDYNYSLIVTTIRYQTINLYTAIPTAYFQISFKMSDHFTIGDLELALSRLNPSQTDTLIDDPIFKLFRKALDEPFSDLQDLWQDIFNLQEYPDIVEYITPIPHFAQHIHSNEPGVFIDYKAMQENLHDLQDYMQGGKQVILDMYDFLNHFTGIHVTFVQSTVSMAIWQLFSKMLDRFYGYITDAPFATFVNKTVEYHSTMKNWPAYKDVKSTITTNIHDAQVQIYKAAQELIRLKSSSDLVTFTSHLVTAAAYKNKVTLESNQLITSDANIDNDDDADLVENPRITRILNRHVGPQTRAALLAKRKAAIARRNARDTNTRISKNNAQRERNKNNVHQYGNTARVPLMDSVVRALSTIQENQRVSLEEEESDEEKKVLGQLNGMSLEEMEQEMKVREPLGGMLVGGGFEVYNVGQQVQA